MGLLTTIRLPPGTRCKIIAAIQIVYLSIIISPVLSVICAGMLFYGTVKEDCTWLRRWLIISYIFIGVTVVVGALSIAEERPLHLAIISLIGVVIESLCSFVVYCFMDELRTRDERKTN